jgi:hypothetical protein
MGMSGSDGPADQADGIATIHAALDAGVDLLDTGDYYGMGHNELLVGGALQDSVPSITRCGERAESLFEVAGGSLRLSPAPGRDGGIRLQVPHVRDVIAQSGQVTSSISPSRPWGTGPPTTINSRPSAPAWNARRTSGATRTTSH